mmetsp:Transcript_39953/g.83601  ORF Transcript_39953/g.83601 Transcript_39953/m.83601 type:complete len:223 (-) Transcript_39953:978-1646(-)
MSSTVPVTHSPPDVSITWTRSPTMTELAPAAPGTRFTSLARRVKSSESSVIISHWTTFASLVQRVSASYRVWPRAMAPVCLSASELMRNSYHASSWSKPRSGHRYASPTWPDAGATRGSATDSACRRASSTSSKKSSGGKPSGMVIMTVWSRFASPSPLDSTFIASPSEHRTASSASCRRFSRALCASSRKGSGRTMPSPLLHRTNPTASNKWHPPSRDDSR